MKRERGFALLLVFVMAAAIAITLYMELPRVAFEAQRNKEALLIERGEQYQRAIQLYVRKFKKYPAKIEDLEETNQIRFLRKRYIDPMTGKSEWRMIHVGPGGVFTDSLTHKPPDKDKQEQKAANTFTYEAPTTGSTIAPGQGDPAFPPARPSERGGFRFPGQTQPGQPGQPGDPANPQQAQQGYPQAGVVPGYPYPNPNQPPGTYQPGVPGMPPGVNPQPAGFNPLLPPGVQANPQPTGFNPLLPPGVQANPQQPYGQPGVYPGAPANSQTGGAPPSFPYSTAPAGVQGAPAQFGQPGLSTTPGMPGQNQALNLINQILTTPRAGGLAGTSQPMAGAMIGPGIAGVASTLERKGIKIYNEKEKYNEWEFIYDLTKDTKGTAQTAGIAGAPGQGTQAQQQGQQTQGTQTGFGVQSTGFGQAAGFGAQQAGFGGQPAGYPQQPQYPQYPQQPQFPQQQPYPQQFPQQQYPQPPQFPRQQAPQQPQVPPQPQPQPTNPP